jgi:hypothetical protein
MSSQAQKRANKQNAQHSTGPRTDQGKQRTSQNAVKHGFRSKHPVIPGEDPAHYQRKLEQIADTSWRLKRLTRIEAAIDSYFIDTAATRERNAGKDQHQVLGDAFTDRGPLRSLAILSRYEGQLSRRFHRLTKELRDLRKTRAETFFVASPYEERHPQRRSQPTNTTGVPNPSIDITAELERHEQTQSIQAILESITSGESGVSHSDPIAGFHRVNPSNPGHQGHQETAK